MPSIIKKYGKKLKPIELEKIISSSIEKSLKRLNKETIELFYIHDENDLMAYGDDLNYFLLKNFDDGKIMNIGISVYNIDLDKFFNNNQIINTIQIPINIFNNKYIEVLKKISKKYQNLSTQCIFKANHFFRS